MAVKTPFPVECTVPQTNGIRFYSIKGDRYKTEHFRIHFYLPLSGDTVSDTYLLPAVMTLGCRKYPTAEAISEKLDDLYDADLHVTTTRRGDMQIITFGFQTLRKSCTPGGEDLFRKALSVLSELLFSPLIKNGRFYKVNLETERHNTILAVRDKLSDKLSYVFEQSRTMAWGDTSYALPVTGTVEQLNRVTPHSLYICYQDMLMRAPAVCFYIGPRDGLELEDTFSAFFSGFPSDRQVYGDAHPHLAMPAVREQPAAEKTDCPVRQTAFCRNYATGIQNGSKEIYAAILFNEILGVSPVSRLYTNVREKLNLCYECSSAYDSLSGMLSVLAGVSEENLTACTDAVEQQLEELRSGNIGDEELETAKKSVITSLRAMSDSPAALLGWYSSRYADGELVAPEADIAQCEAVTAKEISNCAARLRLLSVCTVHGTQNPREDEQID